MRTLMLLSILWLVVACLPTWLLVKGTFFGIGITFFVAAPLRHRWPQYRLLISPWTWLLWNIPTHGKRILFTSACTHRLLFRADRGHLTGEWAIARLQAEAAHQLKDLSLAAPEVTAQDPPVTKQPFVGPMRDPKMTQDTNEQESAARKAPIRLGRYHCTYEKVHGNLSLDTEGIYFELHLTATEKWKLRYTELKSVQKVRHQDYIIHCS